MIQGRGGQPSAGRFRTEPVTFGSVRAAWRRTPDLVSRVALINGDTKARAGRSVQRRPGPRMDAWFHFR